jgi:hypothetical protein
VEKAKSSPLSSTSSPKVDPIPGGNEDKSNASSPSHALLPRVDTAISALSHDNKTSNDNMDEDEDENELTVEYKQGRMSGLFSGAFSRSKLRRKRSTSDIESRNSSTSGSNNRLAFMQNLARSITFPSAIPRTKDGPAKYEIRVEHRSSPRPSTESIISPVLEDEVDKQAAIATELVESSSFSAAAAADCTAKDSTSSQETTLYSSPTKVPVTRPTSRPMSPPLSSAASKPAPPPRPTKSEIPPPSYSSCLAATTDSVTMPHSASAVPLNNPKLAFPHSSSFNSSGVLRSPFLAAVAAKNSSTAAAPSPVATASTAFSTSVSASPITAAASSESSKFKSSQSAGNLQQQQTNAKIQPPITSRIAFVAKKNDDKSSADAIGLSAYERAALAARPPPIPTLQEKKPKEIERDSKSDVAQKEAVDVPTKVTSPTPQPPQLSSFGKPLGSSMTKTSTLPTSLAKAAGNVSHMSKSSTLPVDPGGGLAGKGSGRPEISKPVFQAATPSASALINSAPCTGVSQYSILSTRPERPERRDRSSRGVVFCDPITLPSPTNPNNPPIIHQPSITGSLSSPEDAAPDQTEKQKPSTATIFTPTWSTEPKPLSSDAVMCHIDASDSSKSPSVAAPIATPETVTLEKPPTHDKPLSRLRAKLGGGSNVKRSASAVVESSRENTPEKRLPSPTPSNQSAQSQASLMGRQSFRNLEISGPILQSVVDIKLVPLNNSPASSPLPPPVSTSPQPSRAAPPPPVTPRGLRPSSKTQHAPGVPGSPSTGAVPKVPLKDGKSTIQSSSSSKQRPASMAASRPVRPSAPPPPRPPTSHPPPPPPKKAPEPVYETIKEMSKARPSSIELSSPQENDDGDFLTPTASPLFERKGVYSREKMRQILSPQWKI